MNIRLSKLAYCCAHVSNEHHHEANGQKYHDQSNLTSLVCREKLRNKVGKARKRISTVRSKWIFDEKYRHHIERLF